jgi:hypothetical protein
MRERPAFYRSLFRKKEREREREREREGEKGVRGKSAHFCLRMIQKI